MEPESDTVRFLDLLVSTNGPDLQVQLFNNTADSWYAGKLAVPRLATINSGSRQVVRAAIVVGFIHRALGGSTGPPEFLQAVFEFMVEMTLAGWSLNLLRNALMGQLSKPEKNENETKFLELALESMKT